MSKYFIIDNSKDGLKWFIYRKSDNYLAYVEKKRATERAYYYWINHENLDKIMEICNFFEEIKEAISNDR